MNNPTIMGRVRLKDVWRHVMAMNTSSGVFRTSRGHFFREAGRKGWGLALIIAGLLACPFAAESTPREPITLAAESVVCAYPPPPTYLNLSGHEFTPHRATVFRQGGKTVSVTGEISHILKWRPDDEIYYTIPFQDGKANQSGIQINIARGGFDPFLPFVKAVLELKGINPGMLDQEAAMLTRRLEGYGWEYQAAALVSVIAAVATDPDYCGKIDPPQYVVAVQTGNYKDAGTDANVSITLGSPAGRHGEHTLENYDKDDFEKGRLDVFVISDDQVQGRELSWITLCHDKTGDKSGWYVESVEVQYRRTGYTWTFPVDRWLATDECDKRTCVLLFPGTLPPAPQAGCRR